MRIISLSPSTTEIIFALGAGSQLVANSYFCDYPLEAKKIPKAGSFSYVEPEKVKSFRPDVVFTSTIVQERIAAYLKTIGLNVVHHDPRSIVDILDSVFSVGKIIDKKIEAKKILEIIGRNIRKLDKSRPAKKPRIYVEEWYEPPMYSGNWIPDVVKLAGGEYSVGKKQGASGITSEKELLKYDPEYIFVSYCGFGVTSDPKKVLHRKGWEKITAVKNKHVYALNETVLNRPGPRILESVMEIRKIIFG